VGKVSFCANLYLLRITMQSKAYSERDGIDESSHRRVVILGERALRLIPVPASVLKRIPKGVAFFELFSVGWIDFIQGGMGIDEYV